MKADVLVLCEKHGPSLYCYRQRDGSHVDLSACLCKGAGFHALDCPVDWHRDLAEIEHKSNERVETTRRRIREYGGTVSRPNAAVSKRSVSKKE